jgi:ABC-type bacteriocin/lantibiotic exporter with double-glycine peptidase domain
VRQSAEVQNDMNSVERIVHYTTELEQEPPHEIPECKPASPWPAEGRVELKDVFFKYRPELPDVLRGLTMSVKANEKVGIVGRYVPVDLSRHPLTLLSELELESLRS